MIMPVSNINNADYFIGPSLKDVNPVNRIPAMQTLGPEIQNKYAPNPNTALYSQTQAALLPVDIPKPPVSSSNSQSNPPTSNNNKKFLFIAIAAIVAIILLTKK